MRLCLLLVFCMYSYISVEAQKKLIDFSALRSWPTLQSPIISDNGEYVSYTINNIPASNHTLVIQASDGKWKKEIVGGFNPRFSRDSRWLLCNVNGDSLYISELGTAKIISYSQVKKYEIGGVGKKQWLVIQKAGQMIIYDLTKQTKRIFSSVIDFGLSGNGKSLVVYRVNRPEVQRMIEWINVEKNELWKIWQTDSVDQELAEEFTFDSEGSQVVFTIAKRDKRGDSRQAWFFKPGMLQAVERINSGTAGMPSGFEFANIKFSPDGSRLFFELQEGVDMSLAHSAVMLDVWSSSDVKLQSQQLNEINVKAKYAGVMDLNKNHVIIIQRQNERLYERRGETNEYTLLTTSACHYGDSYWRPSCRVSLYLVNTCDGSRRLIRDSMLFSEHNGFSPDGKYVLYYDPEAQSYFSYAIDGGKTLNITQNIPFSICNLSKASAGLPKPYSFLPQPWLPGNKGVLIYDEYDLWLIDPVGIVPPACLTNGYGRRNGIIFRFINVDERILTEKRVVLVAFRPSDKASGFYSLDLSKCSNPKQLMMGQYLWEGLDGRLPIKAKTSDTWLMQRMSEIEFPNFFTTKDFRSFVRLSRLQPQKNYNWLTTELHEFITSEGRKSQGILYKPENFDSSKRYPLIFHFYEEKSNELHQYLLPEATGSHINIPQFVSHGYLVFVPDIFYEVGKPASGVQSSVVAAAKYVSNLPFVDYTKMGIQGHSWGGYEVNVLVTKSDLFAAAAEAAGPTDFVSGYGSVLRTGISNQFQYESGQNRIKATLWQKPEFYIANSPIFDADKVKTPMLIMHCKRDGAVPFEQGVEWFTALRRLSKPAWMLQYDDGGHQISGKEAEDYTIRLMQFFDHYLKGKPAPRWMTQGIPAKLKGIETGYELDPKGSCGKDCKICKEKKYPSAEPFISCKH